MCSLWTQTLRCPLLHCPSLSVSLTSFSHTDVSPVVPGNAAAAVMCHGLECSPACWKQQDDMLPRKSSTFTLIIRQILRDSLKICFSLFSDSCISSDLGFSEAKWLRWEVSYWSRIVCLFKCDSLGDCMMIWLGWKHFLWYSLLFYIYINIFYGKCPGRILLWHIRFPVSPFLCIWD